MKFRIGILCVIFLVATNQLTGQDLDKLYKIAEGTLYEEEFEDALELFQVIIQKNPKAKPVVYYKAEICSLLSKYPSKPLEGFLKFEEEFSKKDKFYNYWKGRILLRKYKMVEADDAFKTFLSTKAFLSKEIRQEVQSWRKWLEETKEALDNPFAYEIHQLEDRINTATAELSPVYFEEKEELLFVSNRNESKPDEYKIYHSIHRGDRSWTDPKVLSDLGTFERNNSNIEVVAEDGRLFQFRKKKKGDLFFSEPIPGSRDWTAPVEFDSKITSTHLSSHFFINEHEDRIIFASNVGTKRDVNLDLFESFRDPKTGKWSKPKMFSFTINSELNEDSPYLSPDEKSLYFASNGHGSIGGYDIYVSTFDEESQSWLEPINLGFPINSPDDEIHFKLNSDQVSGYFTSNRLNTNGDYDIYFFWEIHKVNLEGTIVDLKTGEPLRGGQIFFRPYQYLDMYFFSEIDEEGRYLASVNSDDILKVEVLQEGKPIHQEDFELHVASTDDTTYVKNFSIGEPVHQVDTTSVTETMTVAEKIEQEAIPEDVQISRLGNKFRDTNTAVLQNVYFDFGTSQLKDESIPILKSIRNLLSNSPEMIIEIAGHTDNIGGSEANQVLGMTRAESVMKWLVKNGVAKKRLSPKSYGSSRPLASNDDEKEGRELNRRIEIVVIE